MQRKGIQSKRLELGNYLYILPALLVVGLVMLVPLIYTLVTSMFKVDIYKNTYTFVWLKNFQSIFTDAVFRQSILNTLRWTAGSVIFQFLVGFGIANILNMDCIRGKSGIRIAVMVPWVLPGVVSALVWQWMYHADFGIINQVLKDIGLINTSINWVSSVNTAMIAAVIINVWKMAPFVILMTEAALQNVPEEQIEAARIDGANNANVFWHVTLPYIAPTCNTVILLLTIWTMNAFTFIYVLTEGGPAHATEILSLFIYRTYFKSYNLGKASAASTILFAVTATVTLFYNKLVIGGNKEE